MTALEGASAGSLTSVRSHRSTTTPRVITAGPKLQLSWCAGVSLRLPQSLSRSRTWTTRQEERHAGGNIRRFAQPAQGHHRLDFGPSLGEFPHNLGLAN